MVNVSYTDGNNNLLTYVDGEEYVYSESADLDRASGDGVAAASSISEICRRY